MDYKHNYPEQYRDIRYKLISEPQLIAFINSMDEILYRKIAKYFPDGEGFYEAMKNRMKPVKPYAIDIDTGKTIELSGIVDMKTTPNLD
jgi:hypothetical protein